MVDNSSAVDAGAVRRAVDDAAAPLVTGDTVVIASVYASQHPGQAGLKGRVDRIARSGSGWRARVAWDGTEPGWVAASRLRRA